MRISDWSSDVCSSDLRRDSDLVLMDVQMPVMDGLEATRRIRALAGRRQPRICAMSASVLDEERQACIDAGMDRHLSKPFRRAELAALLDDIAGAHACSAASTVAGVDDFDRATWAEHDWASGGLGHRGAGREDD